MRFETIYASNYLVRRLQYAHVVKHIRDEGDALLITLQSNEQVMILLIERGMNLGEVQFHLKSNSQVGIYTLMLLWVDIFIPFDGTVMQIPTWMHALDHLHGGKLYGYEVYGREAFFFPIYLEGTGAYRTIRYGNVVNYAHIGGYQVQSAYPPLTGNYYVADFERAGQGYSKQSATERYRHGSPLAVYFELLGLPDGANLDLVKQAYRQLARQFHPDLNSHVDAHQQMSEVNDAYERIMQHYTVEE